MEPGSMNVLHIAFAFGAGGAYAVTFVFAGLPLTI